MTNKTSQKTEEEMLEQTFANFDNEMTGSTEAPEQTQDGNGGTQAPAAAPKKSNNAMIFIGVGVAAVGVLGYMFVKPMLSGGGAAPVQRTPVQAQQTPAQPPVQQPPVQQAPVAQPPVQNTTPAPDSAAAAFLNQQAGTQSPVAQSPAAPAPDSAAAAFLNQQAGTQAPEVAASNPVAASVNVGTQGVSVTTPNATVNTNANGTTVAAVTESAIKAPVVSTNTKPTSQSDAIVDELANRFEQQTKDFKDTLNKVGDRVTVLEKDMEVQKDINKKVDDRLTALENGKPVKTATHSSENNVVRKPVRKVVKPVVKAKVENNDDSVLIDKSSAPAVKPVKVEKAVEAPVYQEFNVHSIYAGRVWLKNLDGSLSTFAAGDRLPSGEIIKRVDDEKFEIATDKRVIRKK